MNFIYLPAYKEYQSQWINPIAIESIYKLSEERVCINYRSGKKQVYSDVWAKIILNYFEDTSSEVSSDARDVRDEPKFQKIMANYQ
jgi:hypothetical protein